MREYGLHAEVDFIHHCNGDLVTPDIFNDNRPQLLITGIVTGDATEDTEIINMWKKINPQLLVVGYSAFMQISRLPVDFIIRKMDADESEQVRDYILDFRSGRLRKKVQHTPHANPNQEPPS